MADKSWIIYLNDKCRILVFLHTQGPLALGFAVVLVANLVDGEVCVTRYDTAHGQAHRDILGKKAGLLEKEWLVDLTSKQAFEYALWDIRENYGNYLKEFLEN